jgi:selenide, water dikinase
VVDDAYDYGAIAAANSLSDVYAMGGEPFLALNIVAFPPDLDLSLQQDILRGAAETARDAGVVIAGGHSIRDKEPKFGLVVLGHARIQNLLTIGAAQPGDHLFITKPLGFGVTTTALKQEKADMADVLEAVTWMKTLNRNASRLACELKLKAVTDITGYSLLGHGWEVAHASQVGLRIDLQKVPFLTRARHYAESGFFPGGASDNRLHFGSHIRFGNRVDEIDQMLLFDPQTSGGLLMCVPDRVVTEFTDRACGMKLPIWKIGRVIPGNSIEVV